VPVYCQIIKTAPCVSLELLVRHHQSNQSLAASPIHRPCLAASSSPTHVTTVFTALIRIISWMLLQCCTALRPTYAYASSTAHHMILK
jgi:hypothetical protein